VLKRKVFKLYLELKQIEYSCEGLDHLIRAYKEAWMALDYRLLQSVIDGIDKRLRAVRKAHG
ncbi:hypothetical protein K432DRAFT_311539, partial [Lepidopterella palustris CBS 459.81]